MKVGWEGKTLHFVSMYVPVQPAKRKVFLSKLFMGKRAIVMGDFNCVENVQLDVRHAAGSVNTVYEKAHSGLLMKILARDKLGDVFRKVHGNNHFAK